jgi:hypothetical protein
MTCTGIPVLVLAVIAVGCGWAYTRLTRALDEEEKR